MSYIRSRHELLKINTCHRCYKFFIFCVPRDSFFASLLISIIWQCLTSKIICSQRNDTKGGYISLSNVKTFSPPERSSMPSWLLSWGLTRLLSSNNCHFGFYPARTPHCDHSAQKHCPVAALSSLHWNHSTEAEGHFNQDLPPVSSVSSVRLWASQGKQTVRRRMLQAGERAIFLQSAPPKEPI